MATTFSVRTSLVRPVEHQFLIKHNGQSLHNPEQVLTETSSNLVYHDSLLALFSCIQIELDSLSFLLDPVYRSVFRLEW